MHVELGPLGGQLNILYASDGSMHPARGARGGGAGCRAWQEKVARDGAVEKLPPYGEVSLEAGDRTRSVTSGGGGYGEALTRDPEAVAEDVREGWISCARARQVYGVEVAADGCVDEAATAALRAR